MSEIKLLSEVGANYAPLAELLATGKWQDADNETRQVMLQIAGRESQGWLNEEAIHKFPCTDLRTLNQLWLAHSDQRFGFSVQQRLYEAVGRDWERLGECVGWRVGGQWLNSTSLTYDTKALPGHLPGCGVWVTSRVWGLWSRSVEYFYIRVSTCQL